MRLLVCLAVLTTWRVVWGQCNVPINSLQAKTPVFLRNNQFMEIQNGAYNWIPEEKTNVTCSKYELKVNASDIQCIGGTNFMLNKSININDLQCRCNLRGKVQNSTACGYSMQGEWHLIGIEADQLFIPYFRTCYDMTKASAIYSEHVLLGDALNYAKSFERPNYFEKGLVPLDNVRTFYTKESFEEQLEKMLGPHQTNRILAISYLARGHLAPSKDGVTSYFMWATFFFDNVVPQWQVINSGNWVRIENAARDKAKALRQNLNVYTGVHEVLELPDDNGVERKIYLALNQLEVPMWLWKVIKDAQTDAAIAFVTYNNPLRAPTAQEMLCTDCCKEYGWIRKEFSDYHKGFTYCCKVDKLRAIVHNIPIEAVASNVLHG